MKAKYKEGTTIYTDWFSEPGNYQDFIIYNIAISGDRINLELYDPRTDEILSWNKRIRNSLNFHIKKYNELFFTRNELRVKKLKNLL